VTAVLDEQLLERLRAEGGTPAPLFLLEDQLSLFPVQPHPRRLAPCRVEPDHAGRSVAVEHPRRKYL
jgi:hypothetical protein